jgi:hypothetical protein
MVLLIVLMTVPPVGMFNQSASRKAAPEMEHQNL